MQLFGMSMSKSIILQEEDRLDLITEHSLRTGKYEIKYCTERSIALMLSQSINYNGLASHLSHL